MAYKKIEIPVASREKAAEAISSLERQYPKPAYLTSCYLDETGGKMVVRGGYTCA